MDDLDIYRPSNLLHTEEAMSRYRPGGFHPVRLGDAFQGGRYKIYHKLGWGGFSAVWLAKDNRDMQWVSIKILTADSTERCRELSTLKYLTARSQGSIFKPIVQLLDDFLHQGPNGTHQCLVLELLGPTLYFVLSDYHTHGGAFLDPEDLEPELIVRLSEQLLRAINFLHEVGYTHGDISGRNIAFTSKGLSQMTEERLFAVLGRPEPEELVRLDGEPLSNHVPSQLVKTTNWKTWTEEDEEDIRIIDFGEAFLQGDRSTKLAQPSSLQAPETIFTDNFDSRLDLWRAGTVIYSLIFGGLPFWQWFGRLDALVEQMIDFVEGLPTEWQQKWDHIQQKYDYALKLETRNPSLPSKLEAKFNEKVREESVKALLPVIQGLMRLRPSDRISISHVLDLVRSIPIESEPEDETDDEMDT